MKQLLIAIVLTSALFSCKKETTTPNNSGNNTTDTTKTTNDVAISGLDCAGVKIEGTLTKDKVASNVTATLSYTGGNGKTYLTKSHTSSGVTGLSATLLAGTLANGVGTLVYTISGTPTTAGTANFAIALGGKSCTIKIVVDDENPKSGYGPNIKDAEGNTYKTVFIGTQQWMAENLKVSKYSDGTTIPNITDNTQWENNNTGAWCYYKNADESNNTKYGKLYNWYAVSPTTNGNKNVCLTGWHVPTDAEWTVLTDYLGGLSVAGGKLKEVGTTNWNSPNNDATNTSLFTGLPGGALINNGIYGAIGNLGFLWSSTESGPTNAWYLGLEGSGGNAYRSSDVKYYGFSVRCLRD